MYLNSKKYLNSKTYIFDFRFENYTSELLIFETFDTNTNSHVENINLCHFVSLIATIYNGCGSGQIASSIKSRYLNVGSCN